jgi:hypothetical protein
MTCAGSNRHAVSVGPPQVPLYPGTAASQIGTCIGGPRSPASSHLPCRPGEYLPSFSTPKGGRPCFRALTPSAHEPAEQHLALLLGVPTQHRIQLSSKPAFRAGGPSNLLESLQGMAVRRQCSPQTQSAGARNQSLNWRRAARYHRGRAASPTQTGVPLSLQPFQLPASLHSR